MWGELSGSHKGLSHRISQIWGENFKSWLYKCDPFFEVDETPSKAKVRIVAMYLEGKALQWHQVFIKARILRDPLSQEEYMIGLGARFGDCLYDEPLGDLKSLDIPEP